MNQAARCPNLNLKGGRQVFWARMSGNSKQVRIQIRESRLAVLEAKKDHAMKYFDQQINDFITKINKLQDTLDHFRDNKVLSEMSWNAKIDAVKLDIQRLENS
jgi:hypothetical protein